MVKVVGLELVVASFLYGSGCGDGGVGCDGGCDGGCDELDDCDCNGGDGSTDVHGGGTAGGGNGVGGGSLTTRFCVSPMTCIGGQGGDWKCDVQSCGLSCGLL